MTVSKMQNPKGTTEKFTTMTATRNICVFAGSSSGVRDEYSTVAKALGRELAAKNCGLVYGGGRVGLMGTLADEALAHGVNVVGIIPKRLFAKEVAHRGLSDLRVVSSMQERKSLMGDLSHGFIALPGGLGTLEELFEVLSWAQLSIHTKPCGILNVGGYYNFLLDFLDHSVSEQFLKSVHKSLLMIENEPSALLDRLISYQAPEAR